MNPRPGAAASPWYGAVLIPFSFKSVLRSSTSGGAGVVAARTLKLPCIVHCAAVLLLRDDRDRYRNRDHGRGDYRDKDRGRGDRGRERLPPKDRPAARR